MGVYLFPGQGSQQVGMGGELFDRYPQLIQQADDILGYSIKELCLHDPNQQLNQTQYTQPALYTINALMYLDKQQQPNFVVGHSLGEYNALFAANVFDFATGLQLVKCRGELMQQATGGGMVAVIGLSLEKLQKAIIEEGFSTIDIASLNASNQIVISGTKKDIEQITPLLKNHGAMMVVPLKVGGAFHSRYMQPTQKQFIQFLSQHTFQAPQIPVIANVTARPYISDDIVNYLVQQLTHSVYWSDSILYLFSQGETNFEEVGPGNVLTGLMRHISAIQTIKD